jgi:hypothetical protein
MSVARKKKPYEFPNHRERNATDQELLRQVKIEAEKLKDSLQKSILDNPKLAKKSALLVSLWIQGKDKKKSKK